MSNGIRKTTISIEIPYSSKEDIIYTSGLLKAAMEKISTSTKILDALSCTTQQSRSICSNSLLLISNGIINSVNRVNKSSKKDVVHREIVINNSIRKIINAVLDTQSRTSNLYKSVSENIDKDVISYDVLKSSLIHVVQSKYFASSIDKGKLVFLGINDDLLPDDIAKGINSIGLGAFRTTTEIREICESYIGFLINVKDEY